MHLKNVTAPGSHDAATWNEGFLDLASVLRHLKEMQYEGWISLEYEPFDRNPTEDCRQFLQWAISEWNASTLVSKL